MYQYIWDEETGGPLLTAQLSSFSKEPRPVYWRELDLLGFNRQWEYPRDDSTPLMWAESNNYIYRGRIVAKTKGGALYTAPELIFLEKPEPDGSPLRPVDLPAMVQKNHRILETLAQETIQKVYNVYRKYKSKVDAFYVAFSGGKDSVVALDIVQKALPHNDFLVLFGDTQMEFPDTYDTVESIKKICEQQHIDFYRAKAKKSPDETWLKFGPPCTVTRWCCSVHKTTPQILLLRTILNKSNFTGLAFVGVRGDESLTRSKYDFISYGKKHNGQFSCNAILDWNSAEVFLYIFDQNLKLNEAYKKGNRRVGCLICPRAAERNDFMSFSCYRNEAESLINSIKLSYKNSFEDPNQLNQFISAGGWKARKNGRDLSIITNYTEMISDENYVTIQISKPKSDWKTWIKTIGILINNSSPYKIKFHDKIITFYLHESEEEILVKIEKSISRAYPEFIKNIKNIFRKTACCIACQACQANCPYGYINFINDKIHINEKCYHCAQCNTIEKGCLVYKSLEQPKGGIIVKGKTMSLNSYSHHAPKMDWIEQYFQYKNTFDHDHSLGSQMYSFFKRFLRDAELLDAKGFTKMAALIDNLGIKNQLSWGIIFTNLCYAPQVQWFVKNIDFNIEYSKNHLSAMMIDSGAKENWTNDICSSLVRLSELPMGELGFGQAVKEKKKAVAIQRSPWATPDPLVILYSLYKFAEACGNQYQFSLSTLLDDSIERDGVSPTRIFGLNRDTAVQILNGLDINYPDFLSASFTLDLDNITLRSDKTSEDVLPLFEK